MRALWLKIQYWMLKRILKAHRNFSTISSQGPESGHYDTYWVFASENKTVTQHPNSQSEIEVVYKLLYSSQGHLLAQRLSNDDKPSRYPKRKVSFEFLDKKELEIRHYYQGTQFRYRKIFSAFFSRYLAISWFVWLVREIVDALSSWLYKLTFKILHDRVLVLRTLISLSDSGIREATAGTVVLKAYGRRIFSIEGKYKSAYQVTEGLLESLVEDDFIKRGNGVYLVTGKTFSGLMDLELEMKQIRSERFNRLAIVALTFILMLVGVVDLYFTYCEMSNKPF